MHSIGDWLRNKKIWCLPVKMTHHRNTGIAGYCMSLHCGSNRRELFNNAAKVISNENKIESTKCKFNRTEDTVRVWRVQNRAICQLSVLKHHNHFVSYQIKMYNKKKEFFVPSIGKAGYHHK